MSTPDTTSDPGPMLPVPHEELLPTVSFTFDDGLECQYRALDVFSPSAVAGTIYVQTGAIGTPGYLTETQIQSLHDAGWDIGSHTHTHPKLTSIPDASIHDELDIARRTLEGMGIADPDSFATPKRAFSLKVRQIVKQYQSNCRNGSIGLNFDGGDPYDLNVMYDLESSYGYLRWCLRQVADEQAWGIFVCHHIGEGFTETISEQKLSDLIAYALDLGIRIKTVKEMRPRRSIQDP